MEEIIYREADLDYIFIRAKLPNGQWSSLSLNDVSDKQFIDWAERSFGIEIKDGPGIENTPWNSQQKISFLNDMTKRLGQPAVTMIRRDARHEWDNEVNN